MHPDIQEILFSQEQIAARVHELGAAVAAQYAPVPSSGERPADRPLLAVGILKGSVPFFADLIRAVPLPLEIDFMALSSYGCGTVSSGEVRIAKDLGTDIAGRDVLVVEDIVDSGRTLACLKRLLAARGPRSVRVCTLLDKPSRRAVPFEPDFVGFTVGDAFVVGCGMDYAGRYRNLPYIGVLEPSVYGG